MTIEVPVQHSTDTPGNHAIASHSSFWKFPDIAAQSAYLKLPDNCAQELISEVTKQNINSVTDSSDIPATRLFATRVAQYLDSGSPGMAIVEQFPVSELTEPQNKHLCQIFSQLIGDLIPQDINNTLLYDVKNKRVANPLNVRKSITNLAQPFHTDGGWLTTPARVIGLFCISNAAHGGGSEMTSLVNAYRELERLYPNEASILREPLPWSKQGEFSVGEQSWEMNPLFENVETRFMGRYYESYVTSGFELMGQDMGNSVQTAMRLLKSIIEKQPRFEMTLKAGDFQLVNNWTNVHARKEFKDSGDLEKVNTQTPVVDINRHLIRVWCE